MIPGDSDLGSVEDPRITILVLCRLYETMPRFNSYEVLLRLSLKFFLAMEHLFKFNLPIGESLGQFFPTRYSLTSKD
jgi:hypothetical protein